MSDLAAFGRLLIILGLIVVVVGVVLMIGGKLPRLPGDIYIRRDTYTIYIPLATSVLLSILLTLIFSVFFGRR